MDSWISIKAKGKNTERIFLAYITITILSLLHKVINIFFLESAQRNCRAVCTRVWLVGLVSASPSCAVTHQLYRTICTEDTPRGNS